MGAPSHDAARRQHGVICYYFDSTKLHETEEALARQREELQLILDSRRPWSSTRTGRITSCGSNRAFADSMGVAQGPVGGRSLFDLYPGAGGGLLEGRPGGPGFGPAKTNIVEPMHTAAGERWVQTARCLAGTPRATSLA